MLLLIDTAGDWCRVAIADAGRVVAASEIGAARGHGERFFDMLAELPADWKTTLAAVAVHCGPGGFTGLRAGIAAATGLAAGYGVPLIGVKADDLAGSASGTALEAMATAAAGRLEAGQFGAVPVYALPPRVTLSGSSGPRLLDDPA
jgi:tRNA threonylcarbamoyl adenosine modification protein YeaZ